MTISQKGINLIKQFEGFFTDAYLCPAGVPTIGFGSTMWADGKKVKLGQKISMEQAEKLLMWEINNKSASLQNLKLNQNQFDAICSFTYNVGMGAFNRSQILKKIKINPNDVTIRDQFMRWVNKGTPYEKGLRRRRIAESNLYYE